MGFGSKVSKQVNALMNKVESFDLLLVVEKLELKDLLGEKFVGELELLVGDLSLVDDMDTNNQLTVVSIVCLWEYPIEQTGSQTIEVQKEFPGLVSTQNFVSQIVRCMVEGMGETGSSICGGLAVCCPDVSLQHSPLPNIIRVTFLTAVAITKQVKHESC